MHLHKTYWMRTKQPSCSQSTSTPLLCGFEENPPSPTDPNWVQTWITLPVSDPGIAQCGQIAHPLGKSGRLETENGKKWAFFKITLDRYPWLLNWHSYHDRTQEKEQ